MNATAIDIKTILEALWPSEVEMYPIMVGKEPASPINVISIFETGVLPHNLTFDPTEIYEYNSVQIRIRSVSYTEGWEIINTIKNILHGRANESWGNSFYTLIRCSSGPALLDYDKSQRVRFIINFYIQRR